MLRNISVHFILPLHTFGYSNNFLYVRKDIEHYGKKRENGNFKICSYLFFYARLL
jgi:hypothetical protein